MPSIVRETYEAPRCPRCSSTRVIQDSESGDVVCGNCGYVIEERTESPWREWRSMGAEETAARERVGAPLTLRRPDLGLATEIPAEKGAERLRFWAKRIQYASRERSLRKGLETVENISSRLKLGRIATERAAYIYRKAVNQKFLKGRSIRSVAATAVYSSCREHGIPRSLDAVAQVGGVTKKVLSRYYRTLRQLFPMKIPQVEPEQYVASFASAFAVDQKLVRMAYSVIRRGKRNGLVVGKDPRGLAAAALYVACLSDETHPSQDALAKFAGVSTFTLRKSVQLLRRYSQNEELPTQETAMH